MNKENWFSPVGVMLSMMVPPPFIFPQRSRKGFVLFGRSWWSRHFPLFSYFWLDHRNHPSCEGFKYCGSIHIFYSSICQSESRINYHRLWARSCPCYGHFGGGGQLSQLVYCRWLETGVLLYRALGTLRLGTGPRHGHCTSHRRPETGEVVTKEDKKLKKYFGV